MSTYNACRAVRRVFGEAGVYEAQNATIHLIRLTVASTPLTNGSDLETVREWLGHADISTTALNLHSTSERKRAAAANLALMG